MGVLVHSCNMCTSHTCVVSAYRRAYRRAYLCVEGRQEGIQEGILVW